MAVKSATLLLLSIALARYTNAKPFSSLMSLIDSECSDGLKPKYEYEITDGGRRNGIGYGGQILKGADEITHAHKLPKRKIWQKRAITWAFRDPFRLVADDESRHLVRVLISTAFALWEDALDGHLEFNDISSLVENSRNIVKPYGVDIDILFAKGSHGDKEAFDGRGKMVAHSAYPPGGVLHLDADENWSFDGSQGVDLRYVMLHEIGHLLGLRHSRKRSSVMSRYYRTLKTGMRIPQVDVESIRRLYGLHERIP